MYKLYKEHRDAGRYTLIYFNGKGRAETIRMLFEASGTQYEDKRVAREDWPELKPIMPFGELPVLEVAGTALGQSGSIARYVSKQVGLEGSTPLEQASTDAICDIVTDIRERAAKVRFTKDPEQQEAAMASFVEYYPKMFGCLERMLESNDGGNSFFVGSSLTRADIHFYTAVELLQTFIPGIITENPLLVQLFDRVQSQENIAKYLERRPVTEF